MHTLHYSPCAPTGGGHIEAPSFVVPVSEARTPCSAPLKLFICAAIAITGGTNASAFHKRVPADQVSPNIGPTTIYAGTDRHRNSQSVPSALATIRMRTKLTWDQLAQIFGVSRRTIHFWSSGAPIKTANSEQVFSLLRRVTGTAEEDTSVLRSELIANAGLPGQVLAKKPLHGLKGAILEYDSRAIYTPKTKRQFARAGGKQRSR